MKNSFFGAMALLPALIFPNDAVAGTKLIKAGADSSGGGKSVVCREGGRVDGRIASIELLDLYESRALFGLAPLPDLGDVNGYLAYIREKITPATDMGKEIARNIEELNGKLRILPAGTRLEPVDDASPIVLPEGCHLEQTAVWLEPALVVVDREHWDAMNARNRAALTAHEVIYNWDRWAGHKTSRHARKVVAHLFSQFEFTGVRDGVPDRNRIFCVATKDGARVMGVLFYPSKNGKLVAHLFDYLGDDLYGKVAHTFEETRFDQFGKGRGDLMRFIPSVFEPAIPLYVRWDGSKPEASRYQVIISRSGRDESLPLKCTP